LPDGPWTISAHAPLNAEALSSSVADADEHAVSLSPYRFGDWITLRIFCVITALHFSSRYAAFHMPRVHRATLNKPSLFP
jgi:hypothetical protein